MAAETQQFPIPDQGYRSKAKSRLESVPRGQISEHADKVRAGETFAMVITAFFFAIGWTFGASWRAVVFCCLAIRYGYRAGAHVTVEAQQPEPARRTRPGPGGTFIEE
jgi:hypothetical protein